MIQPRLTLGVVCDPGGGPLRILIVHPSFQPPGGGNAVASWFLEVLSREHTVTTLTLQPVSTPEINRFFGTALRPDAFRQLQVPERTRRLLGMVPTGGSLIRMHALWRYAKRIVGSYDLVIGTNNESDFGCRGIQYVHYPWMKFPRPEIEYRWFHVEPLLSGYYAVCRALSSFSETSMKANLTLTNSDWTGGVIRQVHGISSTTLYPPVPGPFRSTPWASRKDAFVIIGRFSPEKRIERAIDIIERVRAGGLSADLHVVGTPGPRAYTRSVIDRAERAGPWVRLHTNIPRSDLLDLMAGSRYGLHAMDEEHFGIAVAELQQAGCIPFVPASGGQMEIVGSDPDLLWRDVDDAVDKITRVMRSPDLQQEILARLDRLRPAFSTERFAERLLAIVRDAAAGRKTAS